jgi:pre-60S factor REI1
MRSDWHRYNLKRRVASLPPLSAEIFAEKVLTAQASSTEAAAKASFERTCGACQKTYYSENAFNNHVGSAKHKARLAALARGGDTETASVMSSTISLGEPTEIVGPEDTDDPEVEAEFSKVINGIKDARLTEKSPVSRRPSHPGPSQSSDKSAHPISPTPTPDSEGAQTQTEAPISRCLFCNYDSPTLKLSINHMTKFHGMFIPEQSYLTDVEGLVEYLQAKVSENHECLLCHKLKTSKAAIQTHMRDKGHCMIAFDSEEEMLEIGQFYDFRSTYSDEEEDDDEDSDSDSDMEDAGPSQPGGAKLGAPRKADDMEVDGEGWETDSDEESIDSDEIGSVSVDTAKRRIPRAKHSAPDGFHAHGRNTAYMVDDELHLPSGRTAGHRSYNKYFRQNLHSYPTPEERAEQKLLTEEGEEGEMDVDNEGEEGAKGRQVMKRGEAGIVGLTDQKKRELAAVTKKQLRKAQRQENDVRWRNEKQNNSQKHFRDPLLQ